MKVSKGRIYYIHSKKFFREQNPAGWPSIVTAITVDSRLTDKT